MQTWQQLRDDVQNYRVLHPDCTLAELRFHVSNESIVLENLLTFGQAKAIDDAVFGLSNNAYWLEAYDFPQENDIVTIAGLQRRATGVGIFTFTASDL